LTRIAILGATGHIGKALAHVYAQRVDVRLDLFARRPEAIAAQAASWSPKAEVRCRPLAGFELSDVDLVVNALGAGDPEKIKALGSNIVTLTLEWEAAIAQALAGSPRALYVFLSSGAVYGRLAREGAQRDGRVSFAVNEQRPDEAYGLAKFVAEAAHRARPDRRILDVRIFGFVSPFIDLDGRYFLSELFASLVKGTVFRTGAADMVRDYVDGTDLAGLIGCFLPRSDVNLAVDIFTRRPAAKFEILDRLAPHGLRFEIDPAIPPPAQRVTYASRHHVAASFGYEPRAAATDIVHTVAMQLLPADRRDGSASFPGGRKRLFDAL
jgi:nucleoside-diphosphate-sugar epimerase